MLVDRFKIALFSMLLSFNIAHASDLSSTQASPPSTLYAGFDRLLEDDKTLILEALMDLDPGIKRVALYHNGDRLHRSIPKQVHQMIENKLMGRLIENGRFEVIQCIECRTTKVQITEDELKISQSAEDNQQLRALSKRVRADAFMFWSASVHEDKFTINLRLVDGKNNELLWLKEYSKKTTREAELNGFNEANYELILGTWGIKGTRKSVVSSAESDLEGITVFGIRRRETTDLNEHVEYSLGLEYFTNYSSRDIFDLSGFNVEGRIIADVTSLHDLIETNVYFGIGQSFFNDANSLLFRFGFEFPFFKDGLMGFGVVHMPEADVKWKSDSAFERFGTFGGTSYDLTLGLRF